MLLIMIFSFRGSARMYRLIGMFWYCVDYKLHKTYGIYKKTEAWYRFRSSSSERGLVSILIDIFKREKKKRKKVWKPNDFVKSVFDIDLYRCCIDLYWFRDIGAKITSSRCYKFNRRTNFKVWLLKPIGSRDKQTKKPIDCWCWSRTNRCQCPFPTYVQEQYTQFLAVYRV